MTYIGSILAACNTLINNYIIMYYVKWFTILYFKRSSKNVRFRSFYSTYSPRWNRNASVTACQARARWKHAGWDCPTSVWSATTSRTGSTARPAWWSATPEGYAGCVATRTTCATNRVTTTWARGRSSRTDAVAVAVVTGSSWNRITLNSSTPGPRTWCTWNRHRDSASPTPAWAYWARTAARATSRPSGWTVATWCVADAGSRTIRLWCPSVATALSCGVARSSAAFASTERRCTLVCENIRTSNDVILYNTCVPENGKNFHLI